MQESSKNDQEVIDTVLDAFAQAVMIFFVFISLLRPYWGEIPTSD